MNFKLALLLYVGICFSLIPSEAVTVRRIKEGLSQVYEIHPLFGTGVNPMITPLSD
eukprot:Pgem_evm1s11299